MEETMPIQEVKEVHVVTASSDNETASEDGKAHLKLHKDGVTILQPQPSDDPKDPLNWPQWKKYMVFLAMIPGCLLTDWTLTWGTTLFQAQAPEWGMTIVAVSQSISGGIFMQGPGGLLAVPLCQRYGRLPVLFWSQLLSLIMTIGATTAQGYAGFTACRTLQGFFGAVPQVIGLSIVHDMFFFHERARMVNVWVVSFLIGPYLGPFISAFLLEAITWRSTFAVLCGFYAFSTLVVIFCGDETLYDRGEKMSMADVRIPTSNKAIAHAKLLLGVIGFQKSAVPSRPSIWAVCKHLGSLVIRPYVLLPTLGFVTIFTMWTIGLVSTISQFVLPPPYAFSPTSFALLFFAPMAGVVAAEIWGHYTNDWICNFYVKRHSGQWVPEVRLWGMYIPWVIGIAGLVVYGQTLQLQLSWLGLAFGWAMCVFGSLATTTVVSAYLLDALPGHAALSGAWLCCFRTIGGFSVTYFQMDWVMRSGPAITFGVQGAIIAAAIASIVATQVWGRSWRRKFSAPEFEN